MTREAFIFDAVRTPRGRGRKDGSLHEVKPVDLLGAMFGALQERNKLDTDLVEEAVVGVVNPLGEQGGVIPRSASLLKGWSEKTTGLQVNRFCASGLEAINIVAAKVVAGQLDLGVAGGVEMMSRVPMGSDGGPWAEDIETGVQTNFVPQGISADIIATVDGWTREQVDRFAWRSHRLAAEATKQGYFKKSIVPIKDRNGLPLLAKDELIRESTDLQALGNLKVSFRDLGAAGFDEVARARYPNIGEVSHIHSPGNSSGIADGAGLVLIGTAEAGKKAGLTPRARIVSGITTGGDPTIMLTEPAPATRTMLQRLNLRADSVDLFEVNEAFAAVVLRFIRDLDADPEKVNVNGGAIAMGHPLGATGAVLVSTLVDELERRKQKRGVVTLCAAGGMGIATLIERV